MAIRAESDKKFLRRYLLIAAVCLGYGAWSMYDCVITGPKHMKKANAHWVAAEEDGEEGWAKRHSGEEWTRMAKEKGWPIGEPKTPSAARGYLMFNYSLLAICLPIGAWFLIKYFKTGNTWIEGSSDSLTSSWGQSFKVDDIITIDKKKWDNKGIAKICYNDRSEVKVFVLDDFKYLRKPTDEILYEIEQGLTDEQILNGNREPSAEDKAKFAAEAEAKRAEQEAAIED